MSTASPSSRRIKQGLSSRSFAFAFLYTIFPLLLLSLYITSSTSCSPPSSPPASPSQGGKDNGGRLRLSSSSSSSSSFSSSSKKLTRSNGVRDLGRLLKEEEQKEMHRSSSSKKLLRSNGVRDLGRLLKEEEQKEMDRLLEQERVLLDDCTKIDKKTGIRRPLDRKLLYIPRPNSDSKGKEGKIEKEVVITEEEEEVKVDRGLLIGAYKAKQEQVAALTAFRSKCSRQFSIRRKTKIYPTLSLRIRFPDGSHLQASFHPQEKVSDIIEVIHSALREPHHQQLPPFSLINLGGGKAASLNHTLAECGLHPPAAVLVLQWKKEKEKKGVDSSTSKDREAEGEEEKRGRGGKGGGVGEEETSEREAVVPPKRIEEWIREDLLTDNS